MPEQGILDFLVPVLNSVDHTLGYWLAPRWRLMLWGVVMVGLPWLLYRQLIPVARVRQWQRELFFQRQMRTTFKVMGAKLKGNTMKIARLLLLLGLVRIPVTVLAVGLFVMIAAWLPRQFAFDAPYPGEWVVLKPVTTDAAANWSPRGIHWRPADDVAWSGDLSAWVVRWPGPRSEVRFFDPQGQPLLTLNEHNVGHQLIRKRWWHSLLANPAGYLSDATSLQRIEIQLTPAEYLPWGPSWLRRWWSVLLLMLVALGVWRLWRWWRAPVAEPVTQ